MEKSLICQDLVNCIFILEKKKKKSSVHVYKYLYSKCIDSFLPSNTVTGYYH